MTAPRSVLAASLWLATLAPGAHAAEPVRWERRVLTDTYYCDGVTTGDINRDGHPDVVAGPFWYEGPGFKDRHAFYPPKALDPAASPSDSMYSYVYDFNGDGWPDVLVLGRVHLHAAYWYENPGAGVGKAGPWKKHFAFERVRGESPPFADVDGDGKPELVAHWENRWGFIRPDWAAPAKPWRFTPATAAGDYNQFYHGTGVGDVDGDGRPDLLLNDGWWRQPADRSAGWPANPYKFDAKGGAQMFAYDVNGDGRNDVVTALDAHGWGLAWFEQVRDGAAVTFTEHPIMGDRAALAKYGAAFTQPHALALADVDGDGLKDIVVGKRRWAHGPKGDVEPEAAPVVYWFQLSRGPGGVRFVPHLIDDASGVGTQIAVADVTGDGRADVLTASKLGVFLFVNAGTGKTPAPGKDPPAAAGKPRLVVLTDIGGDPDDQQSLVRLMLYTSEFEVEGLIATAAGTPGELKQAVTKPELIREIVGAYGKVRPNLLLHRPDYPAAADLLGRVKAGNPNRGLKAVGANHDTDGSRHLIAVADRADPRPVNVAVWGGQTDLAQALWRVRADRTPADLKRFLARLRVYDIDDQDGIAGWITENFPDLFYVLAKCRPGADKRTGGYRGMYLGGDEALTSRVWIDQNVRTDCGPLGALYPTKTWTAPNPHACLKEGDTPSWFYFLPTGVSDPAHPEWGGWGGRFRKETGSLYRDVEDTVGVVKEARATVWRWRPAYQADFAGRMSWCVKPVKEANHPPVAVADGDGSVRVVERAVRPGEVVKLSAAGSSDPDSDLLTFHWFVYPEAGTYGRAVPVAGADTETAALTVPADAAGKTIHVVLEVSDGGSPRLTRYRRVVLSVRE